MEIIRDIDIQLESLYRESFKRSHVFVCKNWLTFVSVTHSLVLQTAVR